MVDDGCGGVGATGGTAGSDGVVAPDRLRGEVSRPQPMNRVDDDLGVDKRARGCWVGRW